MKSTKLKESSIMYNFKQEFESTVTIPDAEGNSIPFKLNIETNPKTHTNDVADSFSTLIFTIASIMNSADFKKKDSKTALVFNNAKGIGEMLMACICEPDPESKSWNFVFSFDPEDIKTIPIENVKNFTDTEDVAWCQVYNNCLKTLHNKMVNSIDVINQFTILMIKSIIDWLDSAAEEGEIVELYIQDAPEYMSGVSDEEYEKNSITFATASVEVVKNIKKMSMEFGEEMQAIAKGNLDSAK